MTGAETVIRAKQCTLLALVGGWCAEGHHNSLVVVLFDGPRAHDNLRDRACWVGLIVHVHEGV